MMNVVKFTPPKFKPLPGELTPAVINGATLPVKVEAAKRAIAACCDLSELLTWKDKLAALAAAAKMARMPEMARDVNRVHKEAIFRMGEILLQYSGSLKGDNERKGAGPKQSDRGKIAERVGIKKVVAASAIRLASAPTIVRERILSDDRIPARPKIMAENAPRRSPSGAHNRFSDVALRFFSGISRDDLKFKVTADSRNSGLTAAARVLRNVDVSCIPGLTLEEKQRARKLVVEMQEILDDIDRRLGPDTGVKSCN